MCGISGLVDLRANRPIDRDLLERMNRRVAHRGPDGEGYLLIPGVGFGHRRLSIIDLEGGRQPMTNEDGSVFVTYNGEIYNFLDLRSELIASGHQFSTRCDTEVIVHAWEEWGPRAVERFNGMFAFALWDEARDTLFLARDRIGIKPLYYAELPDGYLAFGSELKVLMEHPHLDRRIDPRAVEEYFTFGYVPDPRSIFANVHKLEPGHHLVVRRGESVGASNRYWNLRLDAPPDPLEEADCVARVVDGLRASVDRRLVSDVPLGAFLSGGIDSSAVVAMMREIGVDRLRTCSIGFDEPRYDESRFADLVAREKCTEHAAETVKTADFELLDRLVDIYDEPYADSSAIPTYRVCELARRHVTVALSGDGGDENFIGYRRYRLFALEQRLRSVVPPAIRRAVFGRLGAWYPKLDWAPRIFRGKTTFQALARGTADAYLHGVSICSDELRGTLFSAGLQRELDGYCAREVFQRHLAGREFDDPMRLVQHLDFKTYLPGDILTKVDRASMAHGLEVRVPFLDHLFVESNAAIPTRLKLSRGEGKYILKKALEPFLPSEVLYRDKMGFAVPLDIWFRGSLRERFRDVLASSHLRDSGLLDMSALDRVAREHISGRRDYSAPLWSVLMFEGFLRATGATL